MKRSLYLGTCVGRDIWRDICQSAGYLHPSYISTKYDRVRDAWHVSQVSVATGEVTDALVSSFQVVVMVDAPLEMQVGVWHNDNDRSCLYVSRGADDACGWCTSS